MPNLTLYKHHRFNVNLLKHLALRAFYCCNKKELNDPFDGEIFLTHSFLHHLFKDDEFYKIGINADDLFNELYKRSTRNEESTYGFQISKKINFIMAENNRMTEFTKLFMDCVELKIISFTHNIVKSKESLMWAHYSGGFNGVRIKYELKEDTLNEADNLLEHGKVNYTKLPEINKMKDVFKYHFCKSSQWKYENEYRILCTHIKYLTFDKQSIKEIVFGINMTTEDINTIIHLCHEIGYKCIYKKMSLENGILKHSLINRADVFRIIQDRFWMGW